MHGCILKIPSFFLLQTLNHHAFPGIFQNECPNAALKPVVNRYHPVAKSDLFLLHLAFPEAPFVEVQSLTSLLEHVQQITLSLTRT